MRAPNQVQKTRRLSAEDEEEELASSLREDCHTLLVAPRCGRGRLARRLPKKMDGGGSPEGGHLQAGPAAQPLG